MKKENKQSNLNRWERANERFLNYQEYLKEKGNKKFDIIYTDLLYISNFKGGNATIDGRCKEVNKKLNIYSKKIEEINIKYESKTLSDLTKEEVEELLGRINSIFELADKKSESYIKGFSISYISVLLAALFDNLIPIIDRRVLLNMGIVSKDNLRKNGQVKKMENFYPSLLRKIYNKAKKSGKNLREIDKDFFIKPLS